MNITDQSNIGQIVAENYRYVSVFKTVGIDFCCNGNRTVQDACKQKGIDSDKLLSQLKEAESKGSQGDEIDYKLWTLDLLADCIQKTHHRYVRQRIEEITPFLNKVVRVHGENHPELYVIGKLFSQSSKDLLAHLQKVENVLFPFIRAMVETKLNNAPIPSSHFETVENPITMMHHEHDTEGERFRKISELSNNYTPPAEACNTYKVTFSLINEFENDLHKHIHLENNILFPKAIALEEELNS